MQAILYDNRMKVLIIDTEGKSSGNMHDAALSAAADLKEKNIEAEIFSVTDETVKGCAGCGKCIRRRRCIFMDSLNACIEKLPECDGFVFCTEVYFGEISERCAAFTERLMHCASEKLTGKPVISVAVTRTGMDQEALRELWKYFETADMTIVSDRDHAVYRENDPDHASLHRALGQLAWLMHCIEAGRKQGYEMPQAERSKDMRFVR